MTTTVIIWTWDIARKILLPLTFDPAQDSGPLWVPPDGRRLLFSSLQSGPANVFIQNTDGTGGATRLFESKNFQYVTGVTSDGAQVVLYENRPGTLRDVRLLTLGPKPTVTSLIETPAEDRGGTVSPNDRWLASESNTGASGRYEIYVTPFPAVKDALWRVCRDGGTQAHWSRSGRELFFVAPDGAIMRVPVEIGGKVFSHESPARLISKPYFHSTTTALSRQYDVSLDDRRFLVASA